MGNFYTNLTLRATEQELFPILTALRRDAYVAFVDGFAVVCDRECDTQDLDIIASLSATLSARLERPVLSALNHDDSVLLFGLFRAGELTCEYSTSPPVETGGPTVSKREFVSRVHDAFGSTPSTREQLVPWWARPLASAILAIVKHEALAAELGLPALTVGAGYRYVDRDDVPRAKKSDFRRL